jgi:outer membrane biosynthesis protein TonB
MFKKCIPGKAMQVVMVDTVGKIAEIRISSRHPVLAAAAKAVQQWQYSPTLPYNESRRHQDSQSSI